MLAQKWALGIFNLTLFSIPDFLELIVFVSFKEFSLSGSSFYGKTKIDHLYVAPNQFFKLMIHSCESNGKVSKFKLHDTEDVKTSENFNKCV